MRSNKLFVFVCAAALLTTMSAAPARAQTIDSRTEFTFKQPVELPNVTLPPGTYVFRFADPTGGKRVMQVLAKDASNKMYGLFMTVSAERSKPSDAAELRFLETPAGQPVGIKSWWYPGDTIGREFIYPKDQALRLARATNQPVLAAQAKDLSSGQIPAGDLTYVSPSGEETRAAAQQQTATATAGAPAAPAQEGTMARADLPKTSTPLAGIGLIGLISMLGAAALRLRG